jgi:hypothetical protein
MHLWASNAVKALPLGVVLPVVLTAATTTPDQAASNISAWVTWIGFTDLPPWLMDRSADGTIALWSVIMAGIYAAIVWRVPLYRKIRTRLAPAPSDGDTDAAANELIDMDTAIQTAIDRTHNTASFEMSRSGKDPITYYAYAIWNDDVRLFGCRPPARVQVEVPVSQRRQFRFFKCDGKMALAFIAEDKPEYTDLRVSKADLEKRISRLIELDVILK